VPAEIRDVQERVQHSGRHLLGLINDILHLSKIEAGRMELSPTEYSVQDIVDTVSAALRSLAVEKGLEFVAEAQEDIPASASDGNHNCGVPAGGTNHHPRIRRDRTWAQHHKEIRRDAWGTPLGGE